MGEAAVRRVLLLAGVVVVMIGAVAGLWVLLGGQGAGANPATVVGIDTDIVGNSPSGLGATQETCVIKAADATFDIDVYVKEIPSGKSLTDLSYFLNFDDTKLEITAQNHTTMLLGATVSGVPIDASEPLTAPDTESPHGVAAGEFADPEVGPKVGVLGRYTVHTLGSATGLIELSLMDINLDGPDGVIVPTEVMSATIAITGTACPTPTPTPTPSPTPTPTPTATATPTATPSPTPSPTPTRTVGLSPPGWHNFVWTGASGTDPGVALACIAGDYSIAYQWLDSVQTWRHYVPGCALPELCNIDPLNQWDALLVLIIADGVTCQMPVAGGPTPTATPSPTPTATATE